MLPTCVTTISFVADLCSHGDDAEVNLVSLLEEQIPQYVLRADTITDFTGYDNSDWIQTPVLAADDAAALDLSPLVIEETLKYFGELSIFLFLRSRAFFYLILGLRKWLFCSVGRRFSTEALKILSRLKNRKILNAER